MEYVVGFCIGLGVAGMFMWLLSIIMAARPAVGPEEELPECSGDWHFARTAGGICQCGNRMVLAEYVLPNGKCASSLGRTIPITPEQIAHVETAEEAGERMARDLYEAAHKEAV